MPYRWLYVVGNENHEWLLKRNCAMGPRELAICLGAVGAVSITIGLAFALSGAILALLFLGKLQDRQLDAR